MAVNNNVNTNDNDNEIHIIKRYRFEPGRSYSRGQQIANAWVRDKFSFNVQTLTHDRYVYETDMHTLLYIFAELIWITNNDAFEITFVNYDEETGDITLSVTFQHGRNADGEQRAVKFVIDDNGCTASMLDLHDVMSRYIPRS